MLNKIYSIHKNFWTKSNFLITVNSFLFFILAIVIKAFSDNYVDNSVSTPVGDLILSNLPTFDVDRFVIQATLIFIAGVLFLLFLKPKYIPFALKTLALFIIVRAFFVTLTHLGTSFHQVIMDPNTLGYDIYNFFFYSKSDYFFSGHTGVPFLLAFIFYKEVKLRYLFFICSFIFGTVMLLGHLHYSIDVFSAPFITYSIFVISKKLFNNDYSLITR